MNVIRVLHLEAGLKNPLQDNWYVKTTLTGIERLLGSPVTRRTPIHPRILIHMFWRLDMSVIADAMFWAACMLMFYGLLRKSNLMPDKVKEFSSKKQFVRSDFVSCTDGAIKVNVKYSKTNQFQKRNFVLKLLPIDHVLSPTAAMHNAFKLCPLSAAAPAFVSDSTGTPMVGRDFNTRLKSVVAATGLEINTISSHSFRRGGASWALQSGIPGEVVQQLGDWKSDCYRQYLDQLPQQVHDYYRELFMKHLPPSPMPHPI